MSLKHATLLACLLATACAPTTARVRINDVAPTAYSAGPTAVGQTVDVDYHRARFSGLAPAPGLVKHLQSILDQLVAQSPVSGIPARVYVRATSVFGAESSADANIYVNFRSLERLGSKDEVAALLAHELAHIVLGHPSSDIVEDVQSRLLTYTALALAVHGAVAQKTGMAARMGMHAEAMVAEALLLQLNQGVVGPAWVRAQEENADLLGLDLLIRAGYAPNAMEALLDAIAEAEKEGIDERGFGTKVRDLFKDRWPELLQSGSDRLMGEMFKMGFEHLVTWLKNDHPDPVRRKELIVEYRQRNYAGLSDRELDADGWRDETRKKDRATKRLFQSYGDAIMASQLLVKKDTKEAMKLATDAASKEMVDHTFIAEALYRVQNAAGARKKTAVQVFDPPARGSEPAWLAFQEMGFAQLTNGKGAAGLETLERGYERLQKPPDAIGPLLYAYERAGKREEAQALANDCTSRFPRMASRGGCRAADPESEKQNAKTEQGSGPKWTNPGNWHVPFGGPGFHP